MMKKIILSLITSFFFLVTLFAQLDIANQMTTITNEAGINSEHLEFSPSYHPLGGIVFISDKPIQNQEGFLDERIHKKTMNLFYVDPINQGQLENPKAFSLALNTKWHEGPVCFNADGSVVYFSRNNLIQKDKGKKASNGVVKQQILCAQKVKGKWKNALPLSFNNKEYDTVHPSLDKSNKTLYFASNRPGGFGGMDLYKVEKKGADWGTPVNLGPTINTPKDEVFPFIHPNGTLFFASDRPGGLGKKDVYYAQSGQQDFIEVVNMGAGINSAADDFGLILNEQTSSGYFSSNREGGNGQDDIYQFVMAPKSSTHFSFHVINEKNGENIENVNVKVMPTPIPGGMLYTGEQGKISFDLKDGKYAVEFTKEGYLPKNISINSPSAINNQTIYLQKDPNCALISGRVVDEAGQALANANVQIMNPSFESSIFTDNNGNFKQCLPCQGTYKVEVNYRGLSSTQNVLINAKCEIYPSDFLGFQLKAIPAPEPIVIPLKRLFYDFNDPQFRDNATAVLDKVVQLLQEDPSMKIEIAAHTDSRGSDSYNQQLSQTRANLVRQYITNQSIDRNRVKGVGYGETQLLNDCEKGIVCSELDHQLNRRTEIQVLNYSIKDLHFRIEENFPERIDPAPNPNSNNRKYLVVAGTFNEPTNASKRLATLQAKGFEQAKLVPRSGSNLNMVVVDTFANRRQANELANSIERDLAISAYVRNK